MPSPPIATYRVQLHAGFTLDDAAIAGYLKDLGVSHLYCSPYLQAAPGSTHGYDVVDPHQVNRELGGFPALDRLEVALQAAGLGQVLDIVPNHMAILAASNPWWWDVLENGPASRYAAYFDVDWDPPAARPANQVLLPVLGSQYGQALEAGEIQVVLHLGDGGIETDPPAAKALFVVQYGDSLFPVDPGSLSSLLARAAELVEDHFPQPAHTLAFLAAAFDRLPAAAAPGGPGGADRPGAGRRVRDTAVLYGLLRRLALEQPAARTGLQTAVDELNADPDALDVFLALQNYRLAFWRMAARELGYRRFFDINSLIGLRVEDDRVFADTHALILDWLRSGRLDGLRVDHPDGLRDPQGYFERLAAARPGGWIVVEKILAPGERLPSGWPVSGTTGYDFLHRTNALFVDPRGAGPLTDFYTEFTGRPGDWEALVREKKLQAIDQALGSDLNHLTSLLQAICERHRRYRDDTRAELRLALGEAAACLPVYRTYVRAGAGQVTPTDVEYVERAVATAKANRPELDPALFDFLGDLLLLRCTGELEGDFAMRFQQFTGPVMAKGVEDTAFYTDYRLVSLNEVGGSPGQFGLSPEEWHRACAATQTRWGRSLLASSTHDTKRSEDVRARIALLSEIPDEWAPAVRRWAQMNEKHRAGGWPDRNDEYLLYQTLVGAWPIDGERLSRYLEKAAREAKTHTSWTSPDPAYEAALLGFAAGALGDADFRREMEIFAGRLVRPGRISSLAQTLLKLTAPGVPDLYQGAELWTDALVDPDNRRPVDYALRRCLLAGLRDNTPPEEVLAGMETGLPKLWVIRQALRLRRERPDLLGPDAGYTPLRVSGEARSPEHAVAFLRGAAAAVVVPRLVMHREDTWPLTSVALPAGAWRDVLTGERLAGGERRLSELLNSFPAALLVKV